jgi:hypothetical protein
VQGSEPGVVDSYEGITGDLTIRSGRVDAEGRAARGLVPTSVIRLERRKHYGRWRTELTIRAQEPIAVQSLAGPQTLENPFIVTRFEFDEDGTPPRMYNRSGALIALPGAAERKALGLPPELQNPEWRASDVLTRAGQMGAVADRGPAAGLLARAADRTARITAIERVFGRRVDQVRGLDRFVQQSGNLIREILVDPQGGVPVEINVARAGRLLSHSALTFQALPNGNLLRRLLRSEMVLSERDNTRMITEIELGNVSFDAGAGR